MPSHKGRRERSSVVIGLCILVTFHTVYAQLDWTSLTRTFNASKPVEDTVANFTGNQTLFFPPSFILLLFIQTISMNKRHWAPN